MSSKHPLPKPKTNGTKPVPAIEEHGVADRRERWNYYTCPGCARVFVTVDVHVGTTPAFVLCRDRPVLVDGKPARAEGCGGTMVSAWYPEPEAWPAEIPRTCDAEWYRPTREERKRIAKRNPSLWQHVEMGGLLSRPPLVPHRFPTIPKDEFIKSLDLDQYKQFTQWMQEGLSAGPKANGVIIDGVLYDKDGAHPLKEEEDDAPDQG